MGKVLSFIFLFSLFTSNVFAKVTMIYSSFEPKDIIEKLSNNEEIHSAEVKSTFYGILNLIEVSQTENGVKLVLEKDSKLNNLFIEVSSLARSLNAEVTQQLQTLIKDKSTHYVWSKIVPVDNAIESSNEFSIYIAETNNFVPLSLFHISDIYNNTSDFLVNVTGSLKKLQENITRYLDENIRFKPSGGYIHQCDYLVAEVASLEFYLDRNEFNYITKDLGLKRELATIQHLTDSEHLEEKASLQEEIRSVREKFKKRDMVIQKLLEKKLTQAFARCAIDKD